MEELITWIVIASLIAYTIYRIISNIKEPYKNFGNIRNQKLYPVLREQVQNRENKLSDVYYKTPVLTKAEYTFYTILEDKCDYADFIICPKVRLEDFINVRNIREKQSYRGRIKSRHVDFLICDRQMKPLCGIELDDSSHNSWKAQKADYFKNELYSAIGLTLYRVTIGSNFEAKIDFIIHDLQQKSTP